MDHVIDMLVLAASILLAVLFIASATGAGKVAARLPNAIADVINGTTSDIAESQYLKYCNKQVTGSDVVSAIRKFKDDSVVVEVTVFLSESQTKVMSTLHEFAGSFQNTPASANYVNPAAVFYGEAVRNSNKVIEKIKFVQEKYVAVAGGAATHKGGGSVLGSEGETQENIPGTEDRENTAQSQPEEDGATDLDIIFSDEAAASEAGNGQDVSEKTAFLGSVQSAVDNYSSELNDMLNLVKSFDIKEGDDSMLSDLKGAIIALKGKVQGFWGQCSASKMLTDAQKKTVKSSLDSIDSDISAAVADIDALRAKLKKYEDGQNSWCIGYPVASDVKATLVGGVLTFSGKGDTAVIQGLPKWYSKRKDVKKVIFESSVHPTKMDYWFEGCIRLSSVNYIPESVESLNGTFRNCKNLSGVLEIKGSNVAGASSFRTCDSEAKKLKVLVKKKSKSAQSLSRYVKQSGSCLSRVNLEVVF